MNAVAHLTRIRLDYAICQKLRPPIRDAYDWHQRVWECFPDRDKCPRDFLTRLDSRDEFWELLILSTLPASRPSWCPTDAFQSKPVPDSFLQNSAYSFSLLANPTRTRVVRLPDGSRKKNGKRAPIITREELISWIQRKGEEGGFSVDIETLKTIPRPQEHFYKEKDKARGTLHAVDFRGTLSITDSARFRETFLKGIGSAKAFGFGMFCLVPQS
jgi:CRISPR system Cascade subunit CasE